MKLLGSTKKELYYGRKKGLVAPLLILVYGKKKGGGFKGRPDFRDKIPQPRANVLGPKPDDVPNLEWSRRIDAHHWQEAKNHLAATVEGIEISGDSSGNNS